MLQFAKGKIEAAVCKKVDWDKADFGGWANSR